MESKEINYVAAWNGDRVSQEYVRITKEHAQMKLGNLLVKHLLTIPGRPVSVTVTETETENPSFHKMTEYRVIAIIADIP